jgi:hypothetical protein
MKLIFDVVFVFTICIHVSADEVEWMSFTYGEFVTALASDSNYLWIGTIDIGTEFLSSIRRFAKSRMDIL